MTNDNRNSQSENTHGILRSAIRDSRASCVQARIRITRIDRDIEQLRRSMRCTLDQAESNSLDMKLRQSLKLRERVSRGLAGTEAHLLQLMQMEQKAQDSYQPASRRTTGERWLPISTDL